MFAARNIPFPNAIYTDTIFILLTNLSIMPLPCFKSNFDVPDKDLLDKNSDILCVTSQMTLNNQYQAHSYRVQLINYIGTKNSDL